MSHSLTYPNTGAGLLETPSLMALQAFAFYLTSVESFQHAHTTALLTKVGIESAKTLHLHQNESQLGLSAFEAEMRRRLWWYFLALDARAAERNGCPELSTVPSADCILPLNVDDQVLTPGMQQLPSSTTKAADMTYCYLRYVMLKMESQQRTSLQARHRDTNPSLGQLNADFERIAKLETRLNDQFLSVDSPGAPFHDIAVATTHMTLCRMRIQAILLQTVGNWAGDASPHSITVLKELFKQHLRVIGYDSSIYNIPRSSGLQWHLRQHFPWRSLLHVLEVLCNHDLSIVDDLVDTWQELDKMHASHPEMINDLLTPVPRLQKDGAEMMLQAWTNCSSRLPVQAVIQPPNFVAILQSRSQAAEASATPVSGPSSSGTTSYTSSPSWHAGSFGFSPTTVSQTLQSQSSPSFLGDSTGVYQSSSYAPNTTSETWF
ncbi:MAG: hypothetical protein Q9162_000505 [Coniocarpon cinnabarinum]